MLLACSNLLAISQLLRLSFETTHTHTDTYTPCRTHTHTHTFTWGSALGCVVIPIIKSPPSWITISLLKGSGQRRGSRGGSGSRRRRKRRRRSRDSRQHYKQAANRTNRTSRNQNLRLASRLRRLWLSWALSLFPLPLCSLAPSPGSALLFFRVYFMRFAWFALTISLVFCALSWYLLLSVMSECAGPTVIWCVAATAAVAVAAVVAANHFTATTATPTTTTLITQQQHSSNMYNTIGYWAIVSAPGNAFGIIKLALPRIGSDWFGLDWIGSHSNGALPVGNCNNALIEL